jgi:2-methylaconitate cis-trans-isomerase PrpF
MTEYQITIGYRAIVTITVKADDEDAAKNIALKIMEKQKKKMISAKVNIENDNYKCDGILDMDGTWNSI